MTRNDDKKHADWMIEDSSDYEEAVYLRRIGRMMIVVFCIALALAACWLLIPYFE